MAFRQGAAMDFACNPYAMFDDPFVTTRDSKPTALEARAADDGFKTVFGSDGRLKKLKAHRESRGDSPARLVAPKEQARRVSQSIVVLPNNGFRRNSTTHRSGDQHPGGEGGGGGEGTPRAVLTRRGSLNNLLDLDEALKETVKDDAARAARAAAGDFMKSGSSGSLGGGGGGAGGVGRKGGSGKASMLAAVEDMAKMVLAPGGGITSVNGLANLSRKAPEAMKQFFEPYLRPRASDASDRISGGSETSEGGEALGRLKVFSDDASSAPPARTPWRKGARPGSARAGGSGSELVASPRRGARRRKATDAELGEADEDVLAGDGPFVMRSARIAAASSCGPEEEAFALGLRSSGSGSNLRPGSGRGRGGGGGGGSAEQIGFPEGGVGGGAGGEDLKINRRRISEGDEEFMADLEARNAGAAERYASRPSPSHGNGGSDGTLGAAAEDGPGASRVTRTGMALKVGGGGGSEGSLSLFSPGASPSLSAASPSPRPGSSKTKKERPGPGKKDRPGSGRGHAPRLKDK